MGFVRFGFPGINPGAIEKNNIETESTGLKPGAIQNLACHEL